jgi:excinuclease UvrABC ATPase subunit
LSGLGATYDFDPRLIVPTIQVDRGRCDRTMARGDRKLLRDAIAKLSHTFGFDPDVAFSKLAKKHRDLILSGRRRRHEGHGETAKPLRRIDDAAMRTNAVDEEFEMPRSRRAAAAAKADPFGRDFEE